MIIPNKHRIISLHILDRSQFIKLFKLHIIDSTFHRLESLTLHGIKPHELMICLHSLITLPRLFSLNIHLHETSNTSMELYHLIFRLPMLKYNRLSVNQSVLLDSIPFTTDVRVSSIEQLVIDHSCTLYELYHILSYTPKLRRLTCTNLLQNGKIDIPFRIFNLTHCSIQRCDLNFNVFEEFIKNISTQLRVLRIVPLLNIDYLDAGRWERLISQHIPYLHTFHFKVHGDFHSPLQLECYHLFLNRFTSSFWIERRWLFKIEIDLERWPISEIIYSIQPNTYV